MEEQSSGGVKVTLQYIQRDISDIKDDMKDLKGQLSGQYVTKEELALTKDKIARIEKIVYGVIGLILTAVIAAAMKFILVK